MGKVKKILVRSKKGFLLKFGLKIQKNTLNLDKYSGSSKNTLEIQKKYSTKFVENTVCIYVFLCLYFFYYDYNCTVFAGERSEYDG